MISVLTSESSYETLKEYSAEWSYIKDIDYPVFVQMMQNKDVFDEMIARITDTSIDWIHVGIQLSSVISSVCGIYTTVVFSLCILYGKTGMLKRNVFVRNPAAAVEAIKIVISHIALSIC